MPPNMKLSQVEVYQRSDLYDEGLWLVAEALAAIKESGQGGSEAEFYRLQGELLMRHGSREAEAEESFLSALRIAQSQKARGWELRAAISLCNYANQINRTGKAYQTLRKIFDVYREGFYTPDLLEARKLLKEINDADL